MANKKKIIVGTEDVKSFHFTMPRDTWVLLKNAATVNELTMSNILINLLEGNRKKLLKQND